MTNELEPLEDDVLSLLRAAKPIVDLAPTAKAALLATVEARVGLPPSPGGGGSAGGGGTAGGGGGGGGSSAAGVGLSGARAIVALAAAFALGVGVGVGGASLGRTAPSSALTVEGPRSAGPERVTAITPSPPAELSAVAVGSLPGASDARTGPLPQKARVELNEPPAPSARGLAAERSLLDVARGALARGEAADALVAVERHGHEYPQGVLVEEREAIAVKALVALGRRDEARVRAARFEQRFPNGIMLRAVKGALGDL
jgi:hypothetical protein